MLLSSPLVTPRQNIVNFFWLFLNLFYSVFFTKLSKIRLLIAKSFNTQSSLNILSSHDLQLFLSNHKAFSCPMCDPRHPVEETYFRYPDIPFLHCYLKPVTLDQDWLVNHRQGRLTPHQGVVYSQTLQTINF